MSKLQRVNLPVISYCEIPEDIAQDNNQLNQASCDVYVMYNVTSVKNQAKYSDNFDLANWIIKEYPELEGQDVLIHLDY